MTVAGGKKLILLGDAETVAERDQWDNEAQRHGCVISEAFDFPAGAAGSVDDLTEVDAVVAALGAAITTRVDIWVPLPGPDFIREQHLRRISLVLQRHRLNLQLTTGMVAAPSDGGFSEIDYALRREVYAVDDLDRAALSSAAVDELAGEIAVALGGTAGPRRLRPVVTRADLAARGGGPFPPVVPYVGAPWAHRRVLLKRYVRWLVEGCGVTQAAAARVLNSMEQGSPTGREWRSATVAGLLSGKYDPVNGERTR